MMNRRFFLCGLGTAMGLIVLPSISTTVARAYSAPEARALPILMFHKVDDSPRYPEDISTNQLQTLFKSLWQQDFYPVNMSDILTNRVDDVVPAGKKPVGITVDDAHRSVFFSCKTVQHPEQRNARSFVEILCDSTTPYGAVPRATLFLSCSNDDRVSKKNEGYFGNSQPLAQIMDNLAAFSGIEAGFHTVPHVLMGKMNASQVRALMDEQIADFASKGVDTANTNLRRILSYPYGVRPSENGIAVLKDMGFLGAVLAFPGSNELQYTTTPPCLYNGILQTDRFLIPRVGVGAFVYARKGAATPYLPIDPLDDFRKDVENALPKLYISNGKKGLSSCTQSVCS